MAGLCALVVTGAPLTARAADLAGALVGAGWRVRVVATPSARSWLDGEAVTSVTGSPPQVEARDPSGPSSPGRPDVVVVAPATFNTVNKLAAGIADTYAHALACEALGAGVRLVVVPMVNHLLWGHPALAANLALLERAGVRLVDVRGGGSAPTAVTSGTGPDVVVAFDPAWITRAAESP